MKLGPIKQTGVRFEIELIFSQKEIEDMGGEAAVQRMCERACEENLRMMQARLEYMRMPVDEDVLEGGFRSDGDQGHHD